MSTSARQPHGRITALLVLSLLGRFTSPATSAPAPARTVLEITVRDSVTREPLPGAEVQLVNEVAVAGEDGSVRLEHPRRKGRALWTGVSAPGHSPYVTWTLAGEESVRETYLFPTSPVSLAGRSTPIDPGVFARHFDVVYRDPGIYGRLTRWMEQPEIVLLNRTLEPRIVDGREVLVTTDSLVGPRIRRRLRQGLRRALGPLTGGFLHARRPRVRRLPAGHVFDDDNLEEWLPHGELVLYVREGPSSYAITRLDESTIVGGAAWIASTVLRAPDSEYSHHVVIHELGHTVGMSHPPSNDNRTPLCSIISYYPCSWFTNQDVATPVDRITARLAYSRLPGNDHDDVDSRPEPTDRRSGRSGMISFDRDPEPE